MGGDSHKPLMGTGRKFLMFFYMILYFCSFDLSILGEIDIKGSSQLLLIHAILFICITLYSSASCLISAFHIMHRLRFLSIFRLLDYHNCFREECRI